MFRPYGLFRHLDLNPFFWNAINICGMEMSSPSQHFPWLDWVRFFSAFLVVIDHGRSVVLVSYRSLARGEQHLFNAALYAATTVADEAVIVFFVLSGFLVGGRAVERMLGGTFRPAEYAIDRGSRIMVPLVPALVLTMCTGWIVKGHTNGWHFLGNLFSLQELWVPPLAPNPPLWSLSYEVWCYVLVGAIGVIAMHRRFSVFAYGAVILVALVFSELFWVYLACWWMGALSYLYRPTQKSGWLLGFAILLCAVSLFFCKAHYASIGSLYRVFGGWLPGEDASRILWATGVSLWVQQLVLRAPVHPWMQKLDRWGGLLAAFSYTLYLVHAPTLALLAWWGLSPSRKVDASALGFLALATACCVLVAYILFLLCEKHTGTVRAWMKKAILRPSSRHS